MLPALIRRRCRPIGSVWLALSLCALPAVAIAGGDAPSAIRYSLAAWSNEQSGDVLSIAQDLDGYLWLGTPEGPVRFDGTRFTRWTPSTTTSSGNGARTARPAAALAASSQGGIWAGFGCGGVARILRGGITHHSAADGAPAGINALLEDRRGTLW